MKKIYLLFVLSVLCMSCSDDFISKNPHSDLNSEGFYKTETDMNQAVLSAYANLRSLYNQTYVRLGEIRSDNTTYSWLSGNPANEKGIDAALGFRLNGISSYHCVEAPIHGSSKVIEFLKEGTKETLHSSMVVDVDPVSLGEKMVADMKEKRRQLGI